MIPFCILAMEDESDRIFMTDLHDRFKSLIYHEIYQITRNEWDTEDLFQITFEKLVPQVSSLRKKERAQLVNYIISTCKHAALNFLRDQRRKPCISFEDYMDVSDEEQGGHMMDFRLMKQEDAASLARVWPKLDERSRYILEGYYILGKSADELANGLGIKPESMRMALTRARKNAYALLEKELNITS